MKALAAALEVLGRDHPPQDPRRAELGMLLSEIGFEDADTGVRGEQDLAFMEQIPHSRTAEYRSLLVPLEAFDAVEGTGWAKDDSSEWDEWDRNQVEQLLKTFGEEGWESGSLVTVMVDANAKPSLYDGNHRLQAALLSREQTGHPTAIPTRVIYRGGAEEQPGVWDPADWPETQQWVLELEAAIGLLGRSALMWHGTSDQNLETILSQGLDPEAGAAVWGDREESDTWQQIQTERMYTYGGTYFTDNLMTAYSSASNAVGQHGGTRLLVAARLELSSPHILVDEDLFPAPPLAIQRALGVVPEAEMWLAYWIGEGFPEIDKVTDAYLEDLAHRYPPSDPRQVAALRDRAQEAIAAWAERELSGQYVNSASWTQGRLLERLPALETWNWREKEQAYRAVLDGMMRSADWIADLESAGYSHNIRSLEPVNYKGSNRIVLVVKAEDIPVPEWDEVGYTGVYEILYGDDGQAASDLIAQVTQRMGPNFLVIDPSGQALYDQPREPREQELEAALRRMM